MIGDDEKLGWEDRLKLIKQAAENVAKKVLGDLSEAPEDDEEELRF